MDARTRRALGPILAIAALGAISGCGRADERTNGVPLAELDMNVAPPSEIALMGPDNVAISEGQGFTITADGDAEAVKNLRFSLEGSTLAVSREADSLSWDEGGTATVRITTPSPRKLTVAGSGKITSERTAGSAEMVIAGSGTIEAPRVAANSVEITIAGGGSIVAAGRTERLHLAVAGDGSSRLAGLQAERVEVDIAGSGNAELASDGEVEARIMGSGNVTVRGSARCTVQKMGSGTLRCEPQSKAAPR